MHVECEWNLGTHLQLLHEAHHVIHDFGRDHFVVFVELALEHTMLDTTILRVNVLVSFQPHYILRHNEVSGRDHVVLRLAPEKLWPASVVVWFG